MWPDSAPTEPHPLWDFQVLPQAIAVFYGPGVNCSPAHASYHCGTHGNNLDMPPKYPDLGSDGSGPSHSSWVCLLTRGLGTESTWPNAHPPTSNIDIMHVYFITSRPFNGGLESGYLLYHLLKEVSECQSYHITSNSSTFHVFWTPTLTNVTKRGAMWNHNVCIWFKSWA